MFWNKKKSIIENKRSEYDWILNLNAPNDVLYYNLTDTNWEYIKTLLAKDCETIGLTTKTIYNDPKIVIYNTNKCTVNIPNIIKHIYFNSAGLNKKLAFFECISETAVKLAETFYTDLDNWSIVNACSIQYKKIEIATKDIATQKIFLPTSAFNFQDSIFVTAIAILVYDTLAEIELSKYRDKLNICLETKNNG